MHRAFSLLTIKEVDETRRTISGIASTPTIDRVGDSVDPLGAVFATPMPLLLYHKGDKPVGTVDFAKPNKNGIPFRASLPIVVEPGIIQDRVNEAWHSIKYKLLAAVSIGFRALDGGMELLKGGGIKFTKWEWLELSLVSVPAQPEAVLQSFKSMDASRILSALGERRADDSAERAALIKSLDTELRAASGRNRSSGGGQIPPGVPGSLKPKSTPKEGKMDINAQVSDLQSKRDGLADQMKAFGDVTTLDETKTAEYDTVSDEFEKVEKDLKRAERMQRAMGQAVEVRGASLDDGSQSRQGIRPAFSSARQSAPELAKGIRFARYVRAMMAGRGSISDALEYAKRWNGQTPEVAQYIRAAAGSANSSSPGWGSELAFQNNLASEFVDLLRAETVMGRIQGFRRVPFNVRIPTQTGGSTVNWVGESAPKPVGELDFSEITLGFSKIAGIVVFSEELSRLSDPSADTLVLNDLVAAVTTFKDEQFLDPTVSPTPNNPGAITYNLTTSITATGNDADSLEADLQDAIRPMRAANIRGNLVIIMNTDLALGISLLRNALGQKVFPEVTPAGGSLLGYPVIVSNSSPSGVITIMCPSEILVAEDPSVRVDASREATLDMAGSTNATYSLWQRNNIGVRAEQWVNYKRRRDLAVAQITGGSYGPAGTSPA